ncbi:MAG: hypothetical protein QW182_03030 [Thermosphaera sp.]
MSVRISIRALAREVGVPKSTLHDWIRRYFSNSHIDIDVLKAFIVLKKRGIKFYTLPPGRVPWPWILVNIFSTNVLENYLNYIGEIGGRVERLVLDAGVDRYWRKRYCDIPLDYTDQYWNMFYEAIDKVKALSKKYGFKYEVVVPDYPDDYSNTWRRKHALWTEECSDVTTNIDRTIENILTIIDSDNKLPWLVPIQGYEDAPQSIAYTLEDLVNRFGYKRYRYALANLCTSKKADIIAETLRLARETCPQCSFHIFGPGLTGVKKSLAFLRYGDSWDSTAWTFPRGSGWSCKNSYERFIYFVLYMKHVYECMGGGR